MRDKINKEVETVRHEVAHGCLCWTSRDVTSLIKEYPRRKGDDVSEANGEDWELEDGECPYDEEVESQSAVADAGSDAESISGDDGAAEPQWHAEASQNKVVNGVGAAMSGEMPSLLDAAANALCDSDVAFEGFHQGIDILKRCGAVKAVHHL